VKEFAYCFIPLFVAIDPLGTLPFLLALTADMTSSQRLRVVRLALLTGLGFGVGFIALGRAIFDFLGIEIADFLIGGGIVLLILSIRHLITGRFVEFAEQIDREIVGVVPLGTPLVVGPAALTTLLLLSGEHRWYYVVGAFLANLAVAGVIFYQADRIAKALGQRGLQAVSHIVSLILAAIAVMLIRRGIQGFLGGL